ncbi:pyroglutamyl-peptidase 1-like [Artemia franciscana]|uniref:Pyroglutamyl-peptidase I n=1 Tax=Artemia franciscana TaxID=6661 RepID=A0AA88IDC9_ARTSF|nr:hypothetical protein QYM36_002633 [Artemia franciscana]KAK2722146.1 hypothetical protein QYM36_002633 [Artemia franciscana]KAK2722147.1 hypothetical protein QYM36_002633 [Artemia franciscana]
MEQSIKPVVLVTGFGPFREHKINASWEAVKYLSNLKDIETDLGIKLITKEIPVEYNYVLEQIPELWHEICPDITIHIGVSSSAQKVNIERCGGNYGYSSVDVAGCLPANNVCLIDGCEVINTGIDIDAIVSAVNCNANSEVCCASGHAGRYLCDFTYYRSLSIDRDRCLFVHVPPMSEEFPSSYVGFLLRSIIMEMLKQVL